jgi:hypothetical protein
MIASLRRHGVEVVALCVDDHHFHLLARFPMPAARSANGTAHQSASAPRAGGDSRSCDAAAARIPIRKDDNIALAIIRHFVGIAKKDSAQILSAMRLVGEGGVWAKRCRVLAIRERSHQLNVFDYIVAHGNRGAAVWTFRDKGVARG